MSGDLILRQALLADADWLALVPADRTIADDAAPQGLQPPFALISVVSSVDDNTLSPGATKRVADRVQLTVFAGSAAQRRAMRRLGRRAARDRMPAIAGFEFVTIHTDTTGPNFLGEGSVRIGSQDFRVAYAEPA